MQVVRVEMSPMPAVWGSEIDVSHNMWPIVERAAREHYRDEREHAEYIDLGGEA